MRKNKIIIKCAYCNCEIERCSSQVKKKNFCNINCKANWQREYNIVSEETKRKISKSVTRENNPNYGNKWTEIQRTKASIIHKKWQKDPNNRWISGTANRGKKFSPETCNNISEGHKGDKNWIYGKHHSEETIRKIGKASAKKFTPEFKAYMRQINEENGFWVPLSQKSDWKIYFQKADWIERMFDRMSTDETKLFKQVGIFSSKNTHGVVRDHMYSRHSGFEAKVFPELLRHPVNCAIILQHDNITKKSTRYIDKDSQTRGQLFEKIKSFIGNWQEQDLCIQLINEYNQGRRWARNV